MGEVMVMARMSIDTLVRFCKMKTTARIVSTNASH